LVIFIGFEKALDVRFVDVERRAGLLAEVVFLEDYEHGSDSWCEWIVSPSPSDRRLAFCSPSLGLP
jgi:hypothetical protein